MKKILFPFYSKYPKLGTFWWHRLGVVTFFFIVLGMFIFTYVDANNAEERKMDGCINSQNYISNPQNYVKTIDEVCGSDFYRVHYRNNLINAIIAMVIFNYLLQILYYKVLLYIFLGKRLHELR